MKVGANLGTSQTSAECLLVPHPTRYKRTGYIVVCHTAWIPYSLYFCFASCCLYVCWCLCAQLSAPVALSLAARGVKYHCVCVLHECCTCNHAPVKASTINGNVKVAFSDSLNRWTLFWRYFTSRLLYIWATSSGSRCATKWAEPTPVSWLLIGYRHRRALFELMKNIYFS